MKTITAMTQDVHGDIHTTCHFSELRLDRAAPSFHALGLLGVHVYLPDMHWAKRVVQRELARADVLDRAREVRAAMVSL